MASLRYAFSVSSSVIMMLKTSARESWRSRSALVSESLTSCSVGQTSYASRGLWKQNLVQIYGCRERGVWNIAVRRWRIRLLCLVHGVVLDCEFKLRLCC